jgi:hypothetical protein
MTTTLWIAQIALGTTFILAGTFKAFRYDRARATLPWVPSVRRGLVRFIGLAELLGGLALILPSVTGVAPILAPVAAVALAVTMLLAAAFHAGRRELRVVPLNIVLGALAAFVACGRWPFINV